MIWDHKTYVKHCLSPNFHWKRIVLAHSTLLFLQWLLNRLSTVIIQPPASTNSKFLSLSLSLSLSLPFSQIFCCQFCGIDSISFELCAHLVEGFTIHFSSFISTGEKGDSVKSVIIKKSANSYLSYFVNFNLSFDWYKRQKERPYISLSLSVVSLPLSHSRINAFYCFMEYSIKSGFKIKD